MKELNWNTFDMLTNSTNEEGLRRYVMLITLLLQQGTYFLHRISNIEYRISNIEYRIWNIEYRISNIEYRISNMEYGIWNIEYLMFRRIYACSPCFSSLHHHCRSTFICLYRNLVALSSCSDSQPNHSYGRSCHFYPLFFHSSYHSLFSPFHSASPLCDVERISNQSKPSSSLS